MFSAPFDAILTLDYIVVPKRQGRNRRFFMSKRQRILPVCILIGLALLLIGCGQKQVKSDVTVAAAANLNDVFQRVGPEFEAETGIHPVFSFGSTAQLAQQIEHGAPFDVFAAADSQHVAEIDQKGLAWKGSRAVYARGVLALWIPTPGKVHVSRIEDLVSNDVRFIAVAKPELAPYGLATVETLQHAGIWEQVKSKVVYAANISVAKQYGVSNNADAVFTAYSLVLKENGKIIQVDESLHGPIDQALCIVADSKHVDAARKFTDFLLAGKGKDILASYGYRIPEKR
jgi:molybdate transport system substrate-binding protein